MRIRIQKSETAAKTNYDFRRLEEKNSLFLPCRIEEEKEAVSMNFDLQGMKSFEELKEEEIYVRLAALIQVAELKEIYRKYEFSLDPGNLYYDMLGRIKVKRRDIISASGRNRMKHFLKQYQALIGYILGRSGVYEDYLYGDLAFLRADGEEELVKLMELETVQEEKKVLSEYYSRLLQKEQENMQKIERKKYRRLIRCSIVSFVLLIVLFLAFLYSLVWYIPKQNKLLMAEDACLNELHQAEEDEAEE